MLNELRALHPELGPDNPTTDTFIGRDEEVVTSIHSLPSDEELHHEFTIKNTSNEDVEIIDDESSITESTEKKQLSKALFEAMDLIESFTLSKTMMLLCK